MARPRRAAPHPASLPAAAASSAFIIGALRGTVPSLPHDARRCSCSRRARSSNSSRAIPSARLRRGQRAGRHPDAAVGSHRSPSESAATDDRVKVLVLQLDYLDGAGQPTLEEVAAALKQFRATGKKIVAYGTALYARRSYYLAAHADEIYLDPIGEVLLEGYRALPHVLQGPARQAAVDVHLFRVGACQDRRPKISCAPTCRRKTARRARST